MASLAAPGCGTSFVPLRLREPATAFAGALRVKAERVFLTDDILAGGIGDESGLVVELTLTNHGTEPYSLSVGGLSCLMEIDSRRPADTLSLLPAGLGEGTFPGDVPTEPSPRGPMAIAPGQTGSYWVLFRGYRFPDSDLPRRITVRMPGVGGPPWDLTLADPGHGRQRWKVEPIDGGWTVGLDNSSLLRDHLRATVVSTQFSRLSRLGPMLWEVGLNSSVLVQTLPTSTSSFAGSGLGTRMTAPLLNWGTPQNPRQIAAYGGATALLLVETQSQEAVDNMTLPSVFGVLAAEAGLELVIGARRLAASPFPLSAVGRGLPRWSTRVGYTRWWVADGVTDGIVSGLRLAW